jgi:uncharacterized membrane protein
MKIEDFGTREAGISLIIISVVLFFLMVSITDQLNQYIHASCTHPAGEVCPMASELPIQSYAGFSLDFAIGAFGVFLVCKSRQARKVQSERKHDLERTLKELDVDEKKVYGLISSSDGVVFQSDIVEKTGFPKAKVTRLLDRMEHRGLVERRRRGMSNIVLLKR